MKITPEYLKTKDMANLLGYSKDYLLKHREILFIEGVHYFQKGNRIDWKVSLMVDWIENNNISLKGEEILSQILS